MSSATSSDLRNESTNVSCTSDHIQATAWRARAVSISPDRPIASRKASTACQTSAMPVPSSAEQARTWADQARQRGRSRCSALA